MGINLLKSIPMETILQHFAFLDIFQVFINAFPAIIKPLFHSFESLFVLMFQGGKTIFSKEPGLIMGLLTATVLYAVYGYFQTLRRNRVRVISH